MDWNFPKPEEDRLFQKHYDEKYGKGAFERDFLHKEQKESQPNHASKNSGHAPDEFDLKRKFYWDYDQSVGVIEKDAQFIGVACLVAKHVGDPESFVKRFGLDFRRDIQWRGISKLLEHLAREEQFKAVLVTTHRVPFDLVPDVPRKLEGRMRWVNRNLEYHKDVFDSVSQNVKASREFGMFPVSKDALEREKAEALNVGRFLDQQRADETQLQSHVKPFRQIKDKVFTASLFFYVYTSVSDTRQQALEEIIKKKTATKIEITNGYFIVCDDVTDPEIVFTGFFPSEDMWRKYGSIALSEEVAGFNPDRDVAIALQKMASMSLEVPPEGARFEEKIVVPDELPFDPQARNALLGYLVASVIERKTTRQKVFFPLDILVKHAIITGGTGKGKTYFAMHLAFEASVNGIDCVVIDPHKHWKFFPKRNNVKIEFVEDAQQVVNILQALYEEAQKLGPQQGSPKLRKLVIIDELSSQRIMAGHRKITPILDSCLSELRKFGTGIVIACQYQSIDRGLTPTVRENAETNFIFRKKDVNDIERIKTMKHVNINMIPFLETGYFLLSSEDFYPEPFFVKAPMIEHLLRHPSKASGQGVDNHDNMGSAEAESEFEKTADQISESMNDLVTATEKLKAAENTEPSLQTNESPPDTERLECVSCGYAWTPRKARENIKRCPSCGTWKWKQE